MESTSRALNQVEANKKIIEAVRFFKTENSPDEFDAFCFDPNLIADTHVLFDNLSKSLGRQIGYTSIE